MLGQRLQSSVDPCELSVFEEQQDFHAQPIDKLLIYAYEVLLVVQSLHSDKAASFSKC